MKNVIELNLFNDFWIDCQQKNILSVLTTANRSYKTAAAMNNYIYGVGGRSGWYKSVTVDYKKDERNFMSFVERKEFDFPPDCDYIEELKKCIDCGRLISIRVDLFYWNPLNILYHKVHANHFSMCFGYDDEEQCLYFDDEAQNEDGFLKVPYERVKKALVFNEGKLFGIESMCLSDIPDYEYSLGDIIENAEKLRENLSSALYTTAWSDFGRKEDISMSVTDMSKLFNRQTANVILFKALMEKGLISEEAFLKYSAGFNEIKVLWQNLHNYTYRNTLKKKGISIEKADEISEKAFEKELELWTDFINEYGQIQNNEKVIFSEKPPKSIKEYFPEISVPVNSKETGIMPDNITMHLNTEDNYTAIIRLSYNSAAGKLVVRGKGGSFKTTSDTSALQGNQACELTVRDNEIYLKTQIPLHDVTLLRYFTLFYSYDTGNAITDSEGNNVAAIDGITLDERIKISAFMNKPYISQVFPLGSGGFHKAEYMDVKEKLVWKKKIYEDYMINFPQELCPTDENYGVFYRYLLDSQTEETVYLHIGYTDEQKIWFNDNKLIELSEREEHFSYSEKRIPMRLKSGLNEIVIFNCSKQGKAERFMLRLELEYNWLKKTNRKIGNFPKAVYGK